MVRLDVGDDGDVDIDIGGEPEQDADQDADDDDDFGRNLAEDLDEGKLSEIANDVMDGVDADEGSRQEWITQYQKAIELLGLKIEDLASGSSGGNKDPSRANDSTLIEAIVRYEAEAEAELCPASGPCKVTTVGQNTPEQEMRAKEFEDDFNYYLTDVAEEYYDDTATMLISQALCGIGYKKVYMCPIRRRPVSESIPAPYLIVSEETTDLMSARRVTHVIQMTKSQIRRLQIAGLYRDITLGDAIEAMGSTMQARRAVLGSEGRSMVMSARPQDRDYTIRECDLDLEDIPGRAERQAPEHMPLPYKVAVEAGSRKILGIWRNWKRGDPLYLKRNCYVKYGLVPGLGFHNWGFMQLIGNQTRNMRTITRLLIASGMYGNFPGGVKAKSLRMSTNEILPMPGEWPDIDVPPGGDISKLLMPMPYKPLDPSFVQLLATIKQDAMRLGATLQIKTGEGRAEVPVGTILAMIEQQIQVMATVHKRNHRAQKRELRKLRELFAETPRKLSILVRDRPRANDITAYLWEKESEFLDLNLQPASDPNIPSQVHRVMLANVLVMLAQQNPQIYDQLAVHRTALQAIGVDPDAYLLRPEQMQGQQSPDPRVLAKMAELQQKSAAMQQEMAIELQKLQVQREKMGVEAASAAAENQTARETSQTKAETERQKSGAKLMGEGQRMALEHQHHDAELAHETAHRDADRAVQRETAIAPQPMGIGVG
jgi:hypothetical protein